jgi:membrane protein required for colicin V production
MNWLDIVIIVALILTIVMGLWSGLIMVLFLLAGTIVGILLAGAYADALGSKLTFLDAGGAHMLGFLIILVGAIIVATILGSLLKMIVKSAVLGVVDKVGGAILGLLVGAIFIGAILTICLKYLGPSDAITSSSLAGFLVDKFGVVLGLLPAQFDSVRSYF